MRTKKQTIPLALITLFVAACEVKVNDQAYSVTRITPEPTDKTWADSDFLICKSSGASIPERWIEVTISKHTYLVGPAVMAESDEVQPIIAPPQEARSVEIKSYNLNTTPSVKIISSGLMTEQRNGSLVYLRDNNPTEWSNRIVLNGASKSLSATLVLEGDMAFSLNCATEAPPVVKLHGAESNHIGCYSENQEYWVSVEAESQFVPANVEDQIMPPRPYFTHRVVVTDMRAGKNVSEAGVRKVSSTTSVIFDASDFQLKLSKNSQANFPGTLEGVAGQTLHLQCQDLNANICIFPPHEGSGSDSSI